MIWILAVSIILNIWLALLAFTAHVELGSQALADLDKEYEQKK